MSDETIPQVPTTPAAPEETAAPTQPEALAAAHDAADPVAPAPTEPPEPTEPIEAQSVAPAAPAHPPLREYAAELLTHTRKLEALVAGRLQAKEDGNLSRAKDFLHEAGQWLDKAQANLEKGQA